MCPAATKGLLLLLTSQTTVRALGARLIQTTEAFVFLLPRMTKCVTRWLVTRCNSPMTKNSRQPNNGDGLTSGCTPYAKYACATKKQKLTPQRN